MSCPLERQAQGLDARADRCERLGKHAAAAAVRRMAKALRDEAAAYRSGRSR